MKWNGNLTHFLYPHVHFSVSRSCAWVLHARRVSVGVTSYPTTVLATRVTLFLYHILVFGKKTLLIKILTIYMLGTRSEIITCSSTLNVENLGVGKHHPYHPSTCTPALQNTHTSFPNSKPRCVFMSLALFCLPPRTEENHRTLRTEESGPFYWKISSRGPINYRLYTLLIYLIFEDSMPISQFLTAAALSHMRYLLELSISPGKLSGWFH